MIKTLLQYDRKINKKMETMASRRVVGTILK